MSVRPTQAALLRFLTRAQGTSRQWLRLQDANARLTKSRDEAQEAHRAMCAFLAGLSHQLRTPLNTILLCSELLSEDLASQGLKAMTGDLDNIENAGKLLLSHLDNIIDLTRMDAGRMVFKQESTNLPGLVERLRASFRELARQNGNSLTVRRDAALRSLDTDSEKLEQILGHLLRNALNYTQAGAVTLCLRGAEDGQGLLFTVQDTGMGMSAEQVQRIRVDFAQTPASHPVAFGSAGLGLTLCRKLAEGLGGSLEVESELGAGSTFSLRIPSST